MPSPNNQDSMPQGGLNAQATPAPAAPPFQSSPYGSAPNAALMAASMDPDKLMAMLKSNTVPDEEIRRHKFLAGLGAPTRSGSIGESFGNALGGLADTEMEQKKLIAQYAPMMLQHMVGIQGNLLKQQELQQNITQQRNSALGQHASALLEGNMPVTIDDLSNRLYTAGYSAGIPGQQIQDYINTITGGKQMSPNADISGMLKKHMVSQMKPEDAVKAMYGTTATKHIEGIGMVPETTGTVGLTNPNAPGFGTTIAQPGMKVETKDLGADRGMWVTDGIESYKANTPEAHDLSQRVAQRVVEFQRKNTNPAPPGTTAPGPVSGNPVPTPPGQYPPGARSNIPLPPPQGAQGPNVPAMPGAPGGSSGQGRMQILEQELASAQTPADKAAIQREIDRLQPQVQQGPKQIAQGVIAVQDPKMDPALSPADMNPTTFKSAVPVNSTVQFNDIPQASDAMDASGRVNPINMQAQKDALAGFQKDTAAHDQVVRSMQDTLRRMQVIQGIAQKVQLGKTAGVREEAAGLLADLGNYFPGLNSETVKKLSDGVAGGDLASLQQLEKLVVSGAMVGLRADIGSSAGQRIAMQEFMMYLQAVPNSKMSPLAIARLREMAVRDYMRARTEQDARAAFAHNGNADYSQFGPYWSDKQAKLGLVPQDITVSGGKGSGLPFATANLSRDKHGRVMAKVGDGKWVYPDDKFLTNGW
jgi:hypothetical protein